MKYKLEDYSISETGYYGLGDEDITGYKEKLVKCRKSHKCASCEKEIGLGGYAVRETGFIDGQPVSAYTCIDCLDKWLDSLNEEE
ncbi:hypothetical protein [Clostridium thermarum]|uniref:hypothetical protein n=1 Tax=Clostridium thermarum TaxID=1716543 RepID=UPI0011228FBA|nr:hypothetical protein [Clostridium thermarum]